jgi:MFS family permease
MEKASKDTVSPLDGKTLSDPTILEVSTIPGYQEGLSWDHAEEKRAVRKVDFCILLFIIIMFTFMQFDRTNISAALTDTIKKDINVGNTQINLAQTLFILGFILTELPFNIISKRIGPTRWLPITMFIWGTCTWCQIFLTGRRGLYACRFFIGAMEGGFIPGTYSSIISHHHNAHSELQRYGILHWPNLHKERTRFAICAILGLKCLCRCAWRSARSWPTILERKTRSQGLAMAVSHW